ncbi:helix-turn-helix domain-containing protein [Streptomyces bauhiniae]|uniref:helix-turn-helix domain-containing protein n=1 Tax=Streptomyces bauhiniae TaxID=2340725 RepID=UPI0035E0EC5B
MPPRQFDGRRVRAVRRRRDMHQRELGEQVGVSAATVARWEAGKDFPKGEKLPGIATALDELLDELFPHEGPPDLQLLRCDAGLTVTEAAEIIGTSRVPVSNAEGGRRRLNDSYVQPLAAAYGVTTDELLAAQDCSFGIRPRNAHSQQEAAPRTLGEKINFLLRYGYGAQSAPSDSEMARLVNAHVGQTAVTAEDIADLRAGNTTKASASVRAGLANALKVDVAILGDDAELNPAVRQLLEAIRFIGSIDRGQILGLAARGNNEGLSVEMMASMNRVVGELKHKLPGVPDEE